MALINKALLHPKEFNVDELKLQFDKEDEEIEQKKQEWAEVRKRMATERRYGIRIETFLFTCLQTHSLTGNN